MSLGQPYYPPNVFFPNINFNNDFFSIPNNNQGITLAYANTHYLFTTGVANSTAISTFFSGGVGIGVPSGIGGSLNAVELQLSGISLSNIFTTSNVLNYSSNVNYIYTSNSSNTLFGYTNTTSNALINFNNATSNSIINYINTTSYNLNSSNILTTSNNLISYMNATSNNLIGYNNATSNNLIAYNNTASNANYNTSFNNYNTLNTKINNSSNDNYNFNIANSNQVYYNNNLCVAVDDLIFATLDNDYCKKSTFLISTNTLLTYNSINYYTYTIDLTKYVRYIQISDITKLLRFKIMASLASSVAVFSYLTECEYTVMMSQSSSIGQTGGFHCRAFGIPEDINLTKFAPYKFVKTNNIYQLTFLSAVQNAKFIITIIDLF